MRVKKRKSPLPSCPRGRQTLSVIAARCQLPRRGSFIRAGRKMPKAPPSGELAANAVSRLRGLLAGEPPSVIAYGDATFPKGTAFGGGDKVSSIAQRRPLGGAGCERSEQTEGVSTETPPVCCADSPLWDGAFGMVGEFLAEAQSAPERRSPLPSSPMAMPPSPRGRLLAAAIRFPA